MTPNPNPSPEANTLLIRAGMHEDTNTATGSVPYSVAVRAVSAALSPQTLPAPGEVERYTEDSVRAMLRGTTKGETLRAWCKANDVNPTHAYEFADGKRNAPADLLGAMGLDRTIVVAHPSPTPATVAAANDEGVALLLAQSEFLCDRLDELDWCEDLDAVANGYSGHVGPALSRLKSTIRTLATSRSQHEGAGR
ncbi:hypothetical protein [Sphingomonas albertensis]|uniref:Uncharacterized protein n=1 Tax=Sphingomonas albertensis TaxID=2762591 RepID=A0ABR7ASA1_9SPHN|nr:hypothetical protein [Sphingomonas albertensis]MBC3943343.1 hypothetical protein [Sphingomonas albertensis]